MRKWMQNSAECGSMTFALIAALTTLGLSLGYTFNQTRQTKQTIDKSRMDRAREISQNGNVSNLALLRALFSSSRIGTSYEPALFPRDYFATRWELQKNDKLRLDAIAVTDNRITVPSYRDGELSEAEALAIFNRSEPQLKMLKVPQTMELLQINADAEHPYWIRSIDVRTGRALAGPGVIGTRGIESLGRIQLDTPLPRQLRVLMRAPGSSTFIEAENDPSEPWPPGEYTFQLRASGVVHFAELQIDGQLLRLGIDEQSGEIRHAANSIRAENVLIGEVRRRLEPLAPDKSGLKYDEQCQIGVSAPDSSSGKVGIKISARVYAVDGTARSELEINRTLYIGSDGAPPAPPAGDNLCRDACPMSHRYDFSGDNRKMAGYFERVLDHESDVRKLDYFEDELSNQIPSSFGRGVICSNMELVGQAVFDQGQKRPSLLLQEDRNHFEQLTNNNMSLKRFYAYLAPACRRQFVGERGEGACGCFAADTLILMADQTQRPASRIRVGDWVWNPLQGRGQAVKRVIAGPEKWPLIDVRAGNWSVQVTGQHPFLTKAGLKSAFALKVGDELINGDGSLIVTALIAQVTDPQAPAPEVWNFELEGDAHADNHYVLANGVMTGDLYLQERLASELNASTLTIVPATAVEETAHE